MNYSELLQLAKGWGNFVSDRIIILRLQNFPRFLDYAESYFEDANAPAFQSRNTIIDFGIDTLKGYAMETPEVRRDTVHDINHMNAEKITSTEASMTKLRDIMMNILKDMKKAYDSEPADIDTSQLTEMMNAMYAQADAIQQERPVTPEDMAKIVVDYLSQTGLDDKAQELLETLCLQIFKGVK